MRHYLIAALLCLLAALAACGTSDRSAPAIVSDPMPQSQHNRTDGSMAGLLPKLSELDSLRGASTLFNVFTVVASSNATVSGGGELTLDAPAGGFAWIVFDLGLQVPDFNIGTTEFTLADWSGITPAPKVFVGITDYTAGFWRFRMTDQATYITNFANLPTGIDFTSPGGHSYLAIVTGEAGLSLGSDIDIAAAAGPGGELPADYTVSFPGMPDDFGLNNELIVRADSSGGDIATFCPNNAGGALVRFEYDDGTDTIATTVKTLFDGGAAEPLASCHAYRLDYYADGRLGIGAARRAPNAIRTVKEDSAGSFVFSPPYDIAVDNTFLPTNFDNPQYAYRLDADGEPHVLFLANNGKLGYAPNVFGGYLVATGGPDISGNISMLMDGTDMLMSYRTGAGTLTVRRMEQCLPNDPGGLDYGTVADAFFDGVNEGGNESDLIIGNGGSILVAHRIFDGGNNQLGLALNTTGVVNDVWTNGDADTGGVDDDDVGGAPSIGLLSNGTPVIAYYDMTNLSLRLAISSTPDGGNATGAVWDNYRIDTSVLGTQVGVFPALGVIHRTAPDPDKIIVAYGVIDGDSESLRIILLDAPTPAT